MNGRFSIKCGPPLKKATQSTTKQAKKSSIKPRKKNQVIIERSQIVSSHLTGEKKNQELEKKDEAIEQEQIPKKSEISKPISKIEKESSQKSNNDKNHERPISKIQKESDPLHQKSTKKTALTQIQQSKIQPETQKRNNQQLKLQTPQQKQKSKTLKQHVSQQPSKENIEMPKKTQQPSKENTEISKKTQQPRTPTQQSKAQAQLKTPTQQLKTPTQQGQDNQQLEQLPIPTSPFSNVQTYSYGYPEDQNLTHDELIQTYQKLASEYKELLENRKILLKENKEVKSKIADAYSIQTSLEQEIIENAKLRFSQSII